jgi:hypothetical protein
VRLEGLGQLKNPMTSSGIEPATQLLQLFYSFTNFIEHRIYHFQLGYLLDPVMSELSPFYIRTVLIMSSSTVNDVYGNDVNEQ